MSIQSLLDSQLVEALHQLEQTGQGRSLPKLRQDGRFVWIQDKVAVDGRLFDCSKRLLNVSSNDYLGLGADKQLLNEFLQRYMSDKEPSQFSIPMLGAMSSRLLTGNHEQLVSLERELKQWYLLACMDNQKVMAQDKSALVFNSGYHLNIGLLPALTKLPVKTLIIADKLVHASIIDGILLSRCEFRRFHHNDIAHLQQLLQQVDDKVKRIIIVTESVFSMDGDKADLKALVVLKQLDSRIELYVDEAHAVGVFGKVGLGVAEETQTLTKIDYLVGTFGKAFASMGAYVLCSSVVKEWLINTARPLIFSTALPEINHAWTRFILAKIPNLQPQRQYLQQISFDVQQAINEKMGQKNPSQSPIIPYILGDNKTTVKKAEQLQQVGFYALPIRPPTVPKNTARIRLVLNANITQAECQSLLENL